MRREEAVAKRTLIRAPRERAPEIVDAFCDAFHDYPVMRYVVGEAGDEYDDRLHTLIGMFVLARVLLDDPILAIEDAGRIVAVATTTPVGERQTHADFPARREAVWKILGDDAKARHEGLIEVWERSKVDGLHLHLNMLGVRRSYAGRGLGRRLLDEVHAMSVRDPQSTGVTLSTEDPKNVPLYEHVGYKVIGHERVTPDLETWSFFRPDDAGA